MTVSFARSMVNEQFAARRPCGNECAIRFAHALDGELAGTELGALGGCRYRRRAKHVR